MNKAFETVGASLETVNLMKNMITQQGLSVNESFALKGSIDSASMSLTGFLYGSDQIASSIPMITEKFGNIMPTTDLIKGVTEVSL